MTMSEKKTGQAGGTGARPPSARQRRTVTQTAERSSVAGSVPDVASAAGPIAPVDAAAAPPSAPTIPQAPVDTASALKTDSDSGFHPAPVDDSPVSLSSPSFPKVTEMTATASFKGYEDVAAFNKANLDAIIQANTVFAKGFEELSKEVISLTQTSLENAATATKAIFAAKSLKDVVELNADFTKSNYEKLLANSTKISELSVKLATATLAPITARATAAVEKVSKPAAEVVEKMTKFTTDAVEKATKTAA